MIRGKTVLVLGAGASYPYGFPLGRELLLTICKRLGEESFNSEMDQLLWWQLLELGFPVEELRSFREDLLKSGQPSVDFFLELRKEYSEVGKACIAGVLLPLEGGDWVTRGIRGEGSEKRLRQRWYEDLFLAIRHGKESFAENELSIVTLNYDRSLERFLFDAIQGSFGVDDREAVELLESIPIYHVYGSLGEFDVDVGRRRPDVEGIGKAAANIRVMSDDSSEDKEDPVKPWSNSIRAIEQADRVVFLGMSYWRLNVERLHLRIKGSDQRTFWGTTYGMGLAEVEMAKEALCGHEMAGGKVRRITLGTETEDVRVFLSNYRALEWY